MGAMLGGAFGVAVNLMELPFQVGHPGAYALVGMAAVFAGASRATLTSIVIIFEMTGDYYIIIPLMFACVIADGVGALFLKDSIYTTKLSRRGLHVETDRNSAVLEHITVREIMHRRVETVTPRTTLKELMKKMMATGHMGFPVVEEHPRDGMSGEAKPTSRKGAEANSGKGRGRLVGIVTHRDFQKAFEDGQFDLTVGDIMSRELVTISRSMTLEQALLSTGWRPFSHLPVVSDEDPKELIGFVTKGDILRAYRFHKVCILEETANLTKADRRRERRKREELRKRHIRELEARRERALRELAQEMEATEMVKEEPAGGEHGGAGKEREDDE
jgi:CIC family chloride channel protein